MKFAVGFQLYNASEEPFSEIVKTYKEHISEVFFAWPDMPTGRGDIASLHGFTDWNSTERLIKELIRLRDMGMKLDLLLNGNCYGEYAISEKLANKVSSIISYIIEKVGALDIVTTASPAIAHTIKKRFPKVEVRASINMKIGDIKGMTYLSELFDSFHIAREHNRDIPHLLSLKEWADKNNKKLLILANSGCFAHCSGQIFHDNMVAHEAEICEINNMKDFMPYVCWQALKKRENWKMLLQNTWIRPEDIHNYEGIFETIKLATRMHSLPGMVIDAYSRRSFCGNTLDLLEPGFGRALAPYVINNLAFPKDWFKRTTECNKLCHKCSYCEEVLNKVLFNTEEQI